MKKVIIISKNKAVSLLPRLVNLGSICYYLCGDYSFFTDLKEKFRDTVEIKNLAGLFDGVFQEIKYSVLDLSAKLNKQYGTFEWWGSHIASRSSSATPLMHNITYLFCAKKILSDSQKDVIFITQSAALGDCILNIAKDCGYNSLDYRKINMAMGILVRYLRCSAHILYFLKVIFQERSAAFKFFKPLPAKKTHSKERIVIRSWVTMNDLEKSGNSGDRNFGFLPEWLSSRGYEIWFLPMFLNISINAKELYRLLKRRNLPYLFPAHYLKFSDYLEALAGTCKLFKHPIKDARIRNIDLSPIFNEVLMRGFYTHLLLLNLSSFMLKRLGEKNFEIDGFYYPFESNPPEKQFILSCRQYFPSSKIIGFQHTTFFPNQLTYHLSPGEQDYHPLPDKIICSGPIYRRFHKEAGFPPEILIAGANLRFKSVYGEKKYNNDIRDSASKMIMLPLTFSYDLAFELFVKVREALSGISGYRICIRNHPLLSKKRHIEFLNKAGINNYEFIDEGVIQGWFSKTHVVISTGASITILEAAVFGVPVIRVIPENTFFYDPFIWPDYPLKPSNSSQEIKRQLELIENIERNDKNIFSRIGKEVCAQYFTQPTDDNLKDFLL